MEGGGRVQSSGGRPPCRSPELRRTPPRFRRKIGRAAVDHRVGAGGPALTSHQPPPDLLIKNYIIKKVKKEKKENWAY